MFSYRNAQLTLTQNHVQRAAQHRQILTLTTEQLHRIKCLAQGQHSGHFYRSGKGAFSVHVNIL